MPLFSKTEVKRLKLETIPAELLRKLCKASNLKIGKTGEMIKYILQSNISETKIDSFIKEEYKNIQKDRQAIISDEDLLKELNKVKNFSWGM